MTNCLKKIHLYMYHESVKMLAGNIYIHWPFIIHQFEIRTSMRFNAINYKSNSIAAPFGFTLLLAAILHNCALEIPYSTTRTVTVFRAIINFLKNNIRNHINK